MHSIPKIQQLSIQDFINHYLKPGRPLIITDAMTQWPAHTLWTPEYLNERFADHPIQIYDDLFNLQEITPLGDYFKTYFNQPSQQTPIPYARWYTQFKQDGIAWSDEAMRILSDDWSLPYFLPIHNYILPLCLEPMSYQPSKMPSPAKGLFISAAGCQTKAHIDPWCSDAVLCQIYGSKSVTCYDPNQPPNQHITGFKATYADHQHTATLLPGEILYIPAGWPHQVTTITDSLSLTWNFVHLQKCHAFLNYLRQPMSRNDQQVLDYFFLQTH